MNVIGAQLDIVWEDRAANLAKIGGMVEALQPAAGTLLVLPEMCLSGFSMEVGKIREGTPSEAVHFLGGLAQKFRIGIVAGVVTSGADGKGRNEAFVIDAEGRLALRYAKMHPFALGGEAKHYSAGDSVVTFHWQGFLVAPFICYDLRFPEIFRAATRKGAQLFTVIANWPVKREQHWVTLLQARAIENQAYVVGVNRCGTDPAYVYPGRTVIVDPMGAIIADAGRGEGTVAAELDLAQVVNWRRDFPALQDARIIAG